MGGGARERPGPVKPRPPPPGRGSRHRRGRSAAAAAARGSAVQSYARCAAGAAASATGKLKGKGDDRVTRPPAGAPRPRSRPRACLGPPPSLGRGCRPSASAPCAKAGTRRRPGRARPGPLATPARPSSPPGLAPWPSPDAPPRPHFSPHAASKAPSSDPRAWARAPPGMAGPAGGRRRPRGRKWARARVGGGCFQTPRHQGSSPGTRRSHFPQFFFSGQTFPGRPGGWCGRGCLQVSSPDWEDQGTSTPPLAT